MTAAAILIPVRPCIKCGATERDKNGNCRACSRAAAKRWYEANKDKALANMRAWQQANPEKFKASGDAWAKANPDKIKAYAKQQSNKPGAKEARAEYYKANTEKFKASADAWHDKNPLEARLYTHNNHAKSLGIGGKLTRGLVSRLFKSQNGMCPCCEKTLGDDFEVDHIQALSRGGANTDFNTQLLRAECNRDKFTQHPVDFMQSRGYLL